MNTDISNPIAFPLFNLLQRLNVLNGFILLLDNQLRNFQKAFKLSYEKNNIDLSYARAGFRFTTRDLTVHQDQKYHKVLDAGKFTKTGQEYIDFAEELVSHWSAWTVAQCYESFETFLRDINAYYYFYHKPSIPIGKLEYIPIDANNIDAWKALFRNRSWNTFTLLEQLRATAPLINKYEKTNILQLNLLHWHTIFAPVRHAIVHSNLQLHRRNIEKLNQGVTENLLSRYFSGEWSTPDIYILNITKEQSKETIQLTADYGHLIFKCLCEVNGDEWQVLHQLS